MIEPLRKKPLSGYIITLYTSLIISVGWLAMNFVTVVGFNTIFYIFPTQQRLEIASILVAKSTVKIQAMCPNVRFQKRNGQNATIKNAMFERNAMRKTASQRAVSNCAVKKAPCNTCQNAMSKSAVKPQYQKPVSRQQTQPNQANGEYPTIEIISQAMARAMATPAMATPQQCHGHAMDLVCIDHGTLH